MSSNILPNKLKIIQFKDIISILIIITIITLSVCSVLGNNFNNVNKPVTARNLAMFASLSYADLENISNYNIEVNSNSKSIPTLNVLTKIEPEDLTFRETQMVSDKQLSTIKSDTTLLGIPLSDEKENTYSYLFYGLASTDEVSDWKIVNYTKFNTTVFNGTAQFSAMTFKKDNDIVIAYRGTDFDDIGDWTQDFFYGLIGYAGQEGVAQDYARIVAEYYTKNNNNINIYITGHSLGGYLAQIGGSTLASNENYSDNLKEVSYFNGMGLQFWSNIIPALSSTSISRHGVNSSELKQLKNNSSSLNTIQNNARIALTNWKNNGGKIISYNINGDIISSLGKHVGKQEGFNAHNICINHHNGNQPTTKVLNEIEKKLSKGLLKIISLVSNKDVSKYVEQYSPSDLLNYIWITHETDSFFAVLPYEDGSISPSIEVKLSTPSTIKRNKTATATLTIITTEGSLRNKNISTNNFTITNKVSLKLLSVSKPQITKLNNGYKYVYTLKFKGGTVIGTSGITLKANILKMNVDNNLCSSKFLNTSNNVIETNYIRTRL